MKTDPMRVDYNGNSMRKAVPGQQDDSPTKTEWLLTGIVNMVERVSKLVSRIFHIIV